MPTSKVQTSNTALQSLPVKMTDGFKSKVVAPRNPKLVKRLDQTTRMMPSVFAKEVSLTTEERLANTYEMHRPRILELLDMSETTHQKVSSVDVDQPMFQPYPSEIVFQNYTPPESYEVPLVLRNNDKIPRLVKVVEEDSLYFKVVSPMDVCIKVAPGMASTFTVLFTPQENKDYIHRVICVTEREKFEVPIRAIGARAILDLPDRLHFPISPVKCTAQKTLLVRNIGNCEAKFQLSTCSPFSVAPPQGTLGIGESTQITVDFLPKTTGDHTQELSLHYHTGEDVYISLYGAATDVNLRLERNSVLLEKTYISMANQRSVAIVNRSDTIVHYQWKSCATEEEEKHQKQRFCVDLQQEEDDEMEQFLTECGADPTARHQLSLLSRTFQERRRQLCDESLAFSPQHIIIEPLEGDVWPNSTAEVNIVFKPQEAKLYQQTVYCDITGRESRLPLRIKGEGIGPKLQVNFDLLDMGNIFIGSKHSYEVLLTNKGLIAALYQILEASSAQGLCFSFSPSTGRVSPGDCHALEVTFTSSTLGVFSEDFHFVIEGNPLPLILTFRGCVMGPTFHFSIPRLNFGEVSFGFPHTLACCLTNTSLVPMTFHLRVPGDGTGPPSITSALQVSQLNRTDWLTGDPSGEWPTEFSIVPSSGTVRAQGQVDLQVTLCSNTVRSYNLALVVDVQGVSEDVLALPICARCSVPEVILETPVLRLEKCFLDYAYEQPVKLINNSDLPACYGLLSQEYEEHPSVLYSSPHPRGVIQPHASAEIPLVVQAKAVGPLEFSIHIAVLGSQHPPLAMLLSCLAEGPVIHVPSAEVDFGNIPVLTDVRRPLQLSNQSPIPARFLAQMARKKSLWRVEPSEGVVPPLGELEIRLVAHLDDSVPFQDKLLLSIQDSNTQTIPVCARGKGTTIVTDRPFAPSLDLGDHFSSGPCQYHFRVTNRGRRYHQLFWCTDGQTPFRCRVTMPKCSPKDMKARYTLTPEASKPPVFSLSPMRLELSPGQSADMVLEGSSDIPKVVQERLVCYGIVGQQSGKERIMTVDVSCRFIAPVLSISSQQLHFYVEKTPDVSLVPLYQKLVLKSVSTLVLSCELTISKPFSLCENSDDSAFVMQKSLVLGVGAWTELWVRFDPLHRRDQATRVAEDILEIRYQGHPQRDLVALKGEVHFPNLHFSSSTLDFGCVLNHTEAQQQITMTNCSPLPVSYRWTFLLDHKHHCIRFAEGASQTQTDPVGGEETQYHWGLSHKRHTNSRMDSNRKSQDTQKLHLEVEGDEEKRDPENDTKEGRGSPKESVPALLIPINTPHGGTPTNTGSFTPRKLVQSGVHSPQWPPKGDLTTSQTPRIHPNIGVEEVFDILPIYGMLQPGGSQPVTFSFFGHANISSQVLALCEVEGGPVYEITLKGEASLVTYSLDTTDFCLGHQLFDRVAEEEIVLRNTGRVGFDFSTLPQDLDGDPDNPPPGQPLVIPSSGHIEANTEQRISVYYLPGVPEAFYKTFQLQVAFFEPETISIRGEGIFPRVCLDLPRDLDELKYGPLLKAARENVEKEKPREELLSRPPTVDGAPLEEDYCPTYDALLQMEVERLLVTENAVSMETTSVEGSDTSGSASRKRKKLSKFTLPDYILDFGYVIHGEVPTHIVKVTNTGPCQVSFRADRRPLAGTGFSTELDRVKHLPYCETETFEVKFDPRGANLELGEVNTIMPIQVAGSPLVQVHLHAVVTMPSLSVSKETLKFDSIQCGMCQLITLQLLNREVVPCEWSLAEEERPKMKIDKHVPLHLRKKLRLAFRPPPVVFEVLPSSGVLFPGDRLNVQVKFSPAEGRAYSQHLVLTVAQSTQRLLLLAQGKGEEPQLEFSTSVLKMGPALPHSAGEETEVIVRNPCPFPVEFYSLEFDKQYLEEEKVLRTLKGYDAQNLLLLPPRAPGETLPAELLEHYQEHCSHESRGELKTGTLKDEEGLEGEWRESVEEDQADLLNAERPLEDNRVEVMAVGSKEIRSREALKDDSQPNSGVGELETNPVTKAIARHLGIDMTPEGQDARNRRGITFIVHGAPLSGKTETAVTLARHYGAACLTLDAVVLEAMASGATPAAIQARELCVRAAQEHSQSKAEEMAHAPADIPSPTAQAPGVLSVDAVSKHTVESTDPKAQASSISTRNKTTVAGGKKTEQTVTSPVTSPTAFSQFHLRLSVSVSQVRELDLMSCLLPEEVLVDILRERLQLSDCLRGVVFDGLETLYCPSLSCTLQAILKALNNRRFIYMVNLSNNYNDFKAKEKAQREDEEAKQREQEQKEKLRFQEMDEEEYDALPEEEKEHFDRQRLQLVRERKCREQKRRERQQEERRRIQEDLERHREEEEMKKRGKKGKKDPVPSKEDAGKKSQLGSKQSSVALRSETKLDHGGQKMSNPQDVKDQSKDVAPTPGEGSRDAEEKKKKPKEAKPGGQEDIPPPNEEQDGEMLSQSDKQLLHRFQVYEHIQVQLCHVLRFWDRAQGLLLRPYNAEEVLEAEDHQCSERQAVSGKKTKKEREKEKERHEKDRLKADGELKLVSPDPSRLPLTGDGADMAEKEGVADAVPQIVIPVSRREHSVAAEILQDGRLPSLDEVLDGLGLGPKGPPIPPPCTFSVVPYPKRSSEASLQHVSDCFTFLVPLSQEDEEKKEAELETELQAAVLKEDTVTPSKGKSKKAEPSKENPKDKRRPSSKKGSKNSESQSPPQNVIPLYDAEEGTHPGDSQQDPNNRLTTFRWIVPPHGEVTLKLWFHSAVLGTFDQTLNFELMGTRTHYQLHCQGICAYPNISRDHKVVFAHCKKIPSVEGDVQKTYIVKEGLFNFGSLLCGKTRDRYKERKYPENMERLVMHNNSPMEAEVHFCFQHDTKATTYLLDPPSMTLKPKEKKELMIWAYPITPCQIEDSLVCCVKDNPEPAVFRLSCHGLRPELELDRKQLHFDKVLLHRKETRNLLLRNTKTLPVAWRLSGMEVLGDEFSVSQDQGIIMPNTDFCVQMHFRAVKPVNLRRSIRLEVADADGILGIVYTENIQVTAEAYDVALDITFPKGADGGLDFGTVKVSEEVRLSVNLKNKGKYDIAYKFVLEPTLPDMPNLNSAFIITPQAATLHPTDRPACVQFTFCYNKEVRIHEQPILRCQIIEPNISNAGETIAIIPIKVSFLSVFSKYLITPSSDINFGPLVYGSRKTRSFTIENIGDFEIRFHVSRICKDIPGPPHKKGLGKRTSRESYSAKQNPGKPRRSESIQKESTAMTQTRFITGVFSLSPSFGVVAPGSSQVVIVECVAEQAGLWQEYLAVDISDRNPLDNIGGIPYHLVAEVCMPGFIKDIASIFEEHHICKNSNMLQCEQFRDASSIYVEGENKFIFNNVLVGQSAKARFRLTNSGKVPCELSLSAKSVQTKATRTTEVFELLPTKMCLPSHSHAFAVITFTPPSMLAYQGIFEVTLEGASSAMSMGKNKLLVLDLVGDGNLPFVSVLRPMVRNRRGQPVLQFKRQLVGRGQTLPLVIKNDGNVPAKATIELQDKMGVFKIKSAPCYSSRIITPVTSEDESGEEGSFGKVVSLVMSVGQQAELEVEFSPRNTRTFEATIRLVVADNLFEETEVQLLGESYQDIVTLDNILSKGLESTNSKSDHLHFGHCHVAKSYQDTFTMTNLSGSDALHFEWPPDGTQVCFSPRVGHLHAGCAKDIAVTFCSKQPVTLSAQLQKCKLCRVIFQQPVDQVADWDDRQRTVKWVDTSKQAGAQKEPARKKVIEIDPEPANTVVENSSRVVELLLSAVCDYAKFTCDSEPIHFKDTMLYQTRVYKLQMTNTGTTKLDFSWQVLYGGETIIPDHRDVSTRSSCQSRCGTALRPCSSLGSVSIMLLRDPDLPPFRVEPSVGAISPGDSQTFCVKFSPIEVAQYEAQLVCSVPNLKDEQGPTIQMRGRSLLPHCHFHLGQSDYITGNRRNLELRGPHGAPPRCALDASTQVIEFTSTGVGVPCTRQFSLVNPTNKPYSYEWQCEDSGPSPFKCCTPNGSILPGKKVEVRFEFHSVALELVESFWTFQIPNLNLSVAFLLVGTAREPMVYIDQAHLNMGSLLIGCVVQHTLCLVNNEKEPFKFAVQKSSCYSESFVDQLQIEPMQGTLPPNDKLPFLMTLKPTQEGEVAFNLAVNVRGRVQPVMLNVKADCYHMRASVQCENPEGQVTEMAPNSLHEVDFKQVELRDKTTFAFLVSNPGLFNLDIQYELWGPAKLQRQLHVKPEHENVAAGKQTRCTVSFYPQEKCVLRDVGLAIKIKHGPVYSCALLGVAEFPGLDFSFQKHNFGKNFIFSAGMTPASKSLVLTNRGERPISVDCSFTNTPFLKVGFQPRLLPPGDCMDVPITFYPQEAKQYHEKLVFGINDCAKKVVEILGQGTEIKLDFEDPRQKMVNLGSLQVGQRSHQLISLINNSALAITFTLQFNSTVDALHDAQVLSMMPSSEVTVQGCGGRCTVELLFTPRERIAPFSEELRLECLGMVRPLLVFKGCCHGVEVKLDQDYLTFGAVVQRCHATRRILMQNTGDIGVRFHWDVKSFLPDFFISPVEGYISTGMEVPFEVTFAPTELCQDRRYDGLTCAIEGSTPISLTLTGSCIVPSTAKEVMNFICQVRFQHTLPLTLTNRSNQRWILKPVIESQHWTGAPTCVIEPYHNKVYEVIYKPVVMTTDKKHLGSIFFPFPDGTGLLYTLVGTAEPPKPVGLISHELPCKTTYTEVLPVQNWLSKPQRFHVLLEIIKPERLDSTVSLKGLDYVDVSGLATKDYKISFFSYKEGLFNAKVTFRNEETGEYLLYLLNFRTTAPGVIRTIEMSTLVRQCTSASVRVENPLPAVLVFTVECRSPDVSLPSQISVPAATWGTLTFEYQPLRPGESITRLVLHNSELGYFHYDLQLNALPPLPEKPLYFRAPLGSGLYVPLKFMNFSRVKAEFTCKTDCPDFVVEKQFSAGPGFQAGIEITTEIYFEPCQLGEVRGLLHLTSSFGGDYTFPLYGTCTPPKAQGPFNIRAGSNVSIPFKNVFLQTTGYSFQVDNPAFTAKGVETVRPKKTHSILVAFDGPPPGHRSPCSGKLTISSPRMEGQGQPISWVYYLKGYTPD